MTAPDFQTDPLGHVYRKLADIEARLLVLRDTHLAVAISDVRSLQDTIRPTIIEREAQK